MMVEAIIGLLHEISVLIAYAQMQLINAHAKLEFKTFLRLHLHPYFVLASSEGSGESAQMRRLP